MSITEYNIRLIILSAVVIVGTPLLSYFEIYKPFTDFFKRKKRYVILIIVTVLIVSLFVFYFVNAFAVKEEILVDANVTKTERFGSFGGFCDTYHITLTSGGKEYEISTPFFGSSELRKKVKKLKAGDCADFMIVSDIDYVYGIEPAESGQ